MEVILIAGLTAAGGYVWGWATGSSGKAKELADISKNISTTVPTTPKEMATKEDLVAITQQIRDLSTANQQLVEANRVLADNLGTCENKRREDLVNGVLLGIMGTCVVLGVVYGLLQHQSRSRPRRTPSAAPRNPNPHYPDHPPPYSAVDAIVGPFDLEPNDGARFRGARDPEGLPARLSDGEDDGQSEIESVDDR
ncbi:hypothetical protein HDU93_007748 [Gonapodya sp. JEL0774]|nr:hypothetical protein HDU93_007748 [Gonapodya sp. JEL0774]